MAVTKRTRYEVLARDKNTCRYCHATDAALTIDHVVPVALGGSDAPENLVTACKDCNAGKSSTSPTGPLVAQVSDDAIRWAAAMKEASGRAAALLRVAQDYVDLFDNRWSSWTYGPHEKLVPRPDGWRTTLDHWYRAGLPIELVLNAADISFAQERVQVFDKWRYMCGIVWKKLTEIQEEAQASLSPVADKREACGHCEPCVQRHFHPEDFTDVSCQALTPRLPDEDPDHPCPFCGELQCVPRYAREGGLSEGWDDGSRYEYMRWANSFERLQTYVLVGVTSPGVRLRRPV